MRILIACDKFKGSLTAAEACEAIALGLGDAVTIDIAPIADGGEGTVDALVTALNGKVEHYQVTGPLAGMRVNAPIGYVTHDGVYTAIVELATTCGLMLIPHARRDPTRTTTFGTGELFNAAAARGVKRIIVGLGGSGTCDAGLGIVQAWGGAIRLRNGKIYGPRDRKLTGADLGNVVAINRFAPSFEGYSSASVEPYRTVLDTRGIAFVAACDVGNVLFGPDGAARVFAPQKGATPEQVDALDDGLRTMSQRLGLSQHAVAPGAGAAGGVGFAMTAFFGARVVSGAQLVCDAIGLPERIARADLVITGEGCFDEQSIGGKTTMTVARMCQRAGKRCVVLAGTLGRGHEHALADGVTAVYSLSDSAPSIEYSIEHASTLLTALAGRVIGAHLHSGEEKSL